MTSLAPRVKFIEDYDFPIIEKEVGGYKVLVLPKSLVDVFDIEGYDAVRINSAKLATKFPQYGGKTTPGQSLLQHQDHGPKDKRRFLVLSKNQPGGRGSSTYIVYPQTVRETIPTLISYLEENKEALKESFVYDAKSQVTEEELLSCFEPGGLVKLVESKIGANPDPEFELFVYSGLLTYLIKGNHADKLVTDFLKNNQDKVFSEDWITDGILIIDNSKVFHGRHGDNSGPLQRNWFIGEE